MAVYKAKLMNYFSRVMMTLLLIYAGTPIPLCKAFETRHFERIEISNETIPHIKMNDNPKASLTSCVLKCNEQEYCIGAGVNKLDGTCNVYGDIKYLTADVYDMKPASGNMWKMAMGSSTKTCPPNFSEHGGSCYWAIPGNFQSWNDGSWMCPLIGGFRMAEFHTSKAMEEFEHHYSAYPASYKMLVGASLSSDSGQFEWLTTHRHVDVLPITDGSGPDPKNCLYWTKAGGFQTVKCDYDLGASGFSFACEAHYTY